MHQSRIYTHPPLIPSSPESVIVTVQRAAARRLLVTIKHMLAVDWCPTLLDVVPMLLVYMPESCAYGVVEELWSERPLFFPVTKRVFDAWSATFKVHRC